MSEEKKRILERVNELIDKRRNELLSQFPVIHEIEDGIVIRFFTSWDNCDTDSNIRFKKIPNKTNPNEIVFFYYLPKGSVIEMKKRDYISCVTCLSGELELDINNKTHYLSSYNKMCLEHDEFKGKALENTYLLTTNMR